MNDSDSAQMRSGSGDRRTSGKPASDAGPAGRSASTPAKGVARGGKSASTPAKGVARGGRFAQQRAAAFVKLNSSLALDWRLWPEDIKGSVAHARALARAGVLTEPEFDTIRSGLAAVAGEIETSQFVPDEADEDVHMAIERRLTEIVGEVGAKLHTGRSRNDQVVTDVRLYLRGVIERQQTTLRDVQQTLLGRAEEHVETLMPAYTHLQRAQVNSLAHHLLAWFWMLGRDRARLGRAQGGCLTLPLGSGAAVGVNYELGGDAVAAELGFTAVAENSLDAVADRDFIVDYLAAAASLGAHLSRIGAEIVLWASAEFGFVELPEAYAGGSSIMPQKLNPDAAELMRAAAPRLTSDLSGLLGLLHGLPLAYNTDLREDKRYLFDAVDCLDDLLPVVRGLVTHLEFKVDRLEAACDQFLLATDVADYLVGRGLPFRESHALTGLLVRRCLSAGIPLDAVTLDELAQLSPAFDAHYYDVLSTRASLQAKRSAGGASPQRVREQLARARASLAKDRATDAL